jgi:hypothetical protein
LQRHAELAKEAEALRASLSDREGRIKSLEAEVALAKESAEVSSSLLKEERDKQVALREDQRVLEEQLGEVISGCLAEGLELQRSLRGVLVGAGAHFPSAEGVCSIEGVLALLRHVRDGVTKLPEVLDAVGNFAAYTSVAGVASLVEAEGCRHVRRLGAKGYKVDEEAVRQPTKSGRTVGRNMTEDLWVKIGRDMLRATAPNPEAVPRPAVASAEVRRTDPSVATMPEVSASGDTTVAVATASEVCAFSQRLS